MEGQRRVLLFPLPLKGHINPMLQLSNILHSKGFSITIIYTNFNNYSPNIQVNYHHFTFHPISDGLSDYEKSTTDRDVLLLLSLLNDKCAPHFREALAKLLLEDPNNIACLISDCILHFTKAIAHGFKLPWLVLRTGGVSSFLTFADFPLLQNKPYFPLQVSQLEEAVEELPRLRNKDLPVFETSNMDGLYEVIKGMTQETKGLFGKPPRWLGPG